MKKYHHLIGKKVCYVTEKVPLYPSSPNEPRVFKSHYNKEVVVGLYSSVSLDGRRLGEFAIMASGQHVEVSLLFTHEIYQPPTNKEAA